FSAAPGGATSVSVSIFRLPRRQPAKQTKRATISAAAESAHGKPKGTPARPISTAKEDHKSDEKWRASASSAWLDVFSAVRERAGARKKSTTCEAPMTANAQTVAFTIWASCSTSRLMASQITTPDKRKSKAVSASAETASTLPWP